MSLTELAERQIPVLDIIKELVKETGGDLCVIRTPIEYIRRIRSFPFIIFEGLFDSSDTVEFKLMINKTFCLNLSNEQLEDMNTIWDVVFQVVFTELKKSILTVTDGIPEEVIKNLDLSDKIEDLGMSSMVNIEIVSVMMKVFSVQIPRSKPVTGDVYGLVFLITHHIFDEANKK